MKPIYASRLFKASTRKDKIIAAIQNPVNAELVQQLEEYLSDVTGPTSNDRVPNSRELTRDDVPQGRVSKIPEGSNYDVVRKHLTVDDIHDVDDIDDTEDSVNDDIDEADDEADPDTEDENDVNSLTKLSGSSVTSATTLYNNIQQPNTIDVASKIEVIRGTLNSRSDTCGVNRILLKENDSELWIHYEDKINLNNVMGAVIELLNGLSYTYLEFNRLARSENAIVFEVRVEEADSSTNDTSKEGNADE